MKLEKILGLIAVILAIVGAFVTIPYLAAALVIIGLVIGFSIDAADHVRVIVSALALTALAGALSSIPAIGGHLTSIVSSLGVVAAGAAIMIILRNIYARFKP
jgi:hypothetical protein